MKNVFTDERIRRQEAQRELVVQQPAEHLVIRAIHERCSNDIHQPFIEDSALLLDFEEFLPVLCDTGMKNTPMPA